MSSTVTKYIVWNNRDNKVEAGPFNNTADADTALRRVLTKRDGLGKQVSVLTREQITSVEQK